MKHIKLALALLSVTVLAIGCKDSEDQTTADSTKTTSQQMDKVAQDTKEAAREVKDYAYAQKTEFIGTMRSQSSELHKDLDELSARVGRATDKAKADAQPKLQALREQVAKLDQQIDAAKDATESTWDDVKGGFRKGYAEVKDGFQQARQWVSDKIAP